MCACTFLFVDCTILLQSEIVVDNNPSKSVNTKEQIISITAEKTSATDARGSTSLESPKGAQEKVNFLGKGGEQPYVYQTNVYAPQPQTVYSGGYINPSGQWEEYPYYVSMEGLHSASPSIMLSPGYANNPQMMYGAYSPVATVGEGQSYSPMHFPFSSPYYQPPASLSMGYSNSSTGMSQGDPMLQQEYFLPDGLLYSPTTVYHQPFESYNRAATQPSNAPGLFGQGNAPLVSGMVNGSGQFCGVAEMIGPVDFDRSVDYWQQDKWSGQFPVKWHIIKDVPNTLLRHITLENNDNKPVTNSRDTQEVKLEYGLQMLSIFKNHEAETSIVEDFDFYEQREKALKENRRQQQPGSAESLKPTDAKAVGNSVTHIADSFSRSVQLKEIEKSDNKLTADGAISVNDAQTATVKAEESNANKTKGPVEESS
ncbi:hypothetical protein ACQJBY_064648 [Aegilops geniculata]